MTLGHEIDLAISQNAIAERDRVISCQQSNIERMETQLREICLLCGFDPSDGEGTSAEDVTKAVKNTIDVLRTALGHYARCTDGSRRTWTDDVDSYGQIAMPVEFPWEIAEKALNDTKPSDVLAKICDKPI